MEIPDAIIHRWGIIGIAVFYIVDKILHWVWGSTTKWIASVNANTQALNELKTTVDVGFATLNTRLEAIDKDLRTAFINIKEIRDKEGMGKLTRIDS